MKTEDWTISYKAKGSERVFASTYAFPSGSSEQTVRIRTLGLLGANKEIVSVVKAERQPYNNGG